MISDEKLVYYKEESEKAIKILERIHNMKVTSLEFQIALADRCGLKQRESHHVAQFSFTAEQMVEKLNGYPFYHPEVLGDITIPREAFPEGVPEVLNEQKIRQKGRVWQIHKYDPDPFPSNPHAHEIGTGYKMHLGTGDIYNKKYIIGRVSKKTLEAIRAQIQQFTSTQLPKLEG